MAEVKQFSRIQNHRLTTSGQVPTIPSVDDVTDSSFLATDLKNGELCVNTADDNIFFRSGSSIIEISTTSVPGTSPWVFDGNDIKTNAVIGSPAVYPKVLPQVDDQIDLGSSALRWKNLYLTNYDFTSIYASATIDTFQIIGSTTSNSYTFDFNYIKTLLDDNSGNYAMISMGTDQTGSVSNYFQNMIYSTDSLNNYCFITTGVSDGKTIKILSTDGTNQSNVNINESEIVINSQSQSSVTINGNSKIAFNNNGISIPQYSTISINSTGTAPICGKATLSSGTVTVNTTSVTADSIILLTPQNGGSTGDVYISARTAGTSFTITSSNGADAREIGWLIVEKA